MEEGVVLASVVVNQRERVGDGGVTVDGVRRHHNKGGTVNLKHSGAGAGSIHDRAIVNHPIGQSEFPPAKISVVLTPPIHHLDFPLAVHRTANQVAE